MEKGMVPWKRIWTHRQEIMPWENEWHHNGKTNDAMRESLVPQHIMMPCQREWCHARKNGAMGRRTMPRERTAPQEKECYRGGQDIAVKVLEDCIQRTRRIPREMKLLGRHSLQARRTVLGLTVIPVTNLCIQKPSRHCNYYNELQCLEVDLYPVTPVLGVD